MLLIIRSFTLIGVCVFLSWQFTVEQIINPASERSHLSAQSSVLSGPTGNPLAVQRLTSGLEDQAKRATTGFSTLSLQTATVVLLTSSACASTNFLAFAGNHKTCSWLAVQFEFVIVFDFHFLTARSRSDGQRAAGGVGGHGVEHAPAMSRRPPPWRSSFVQQTRQQPSHRTRPSPTPSPWCRAAIPCGR